MGAHSLCECMHKHQGDSHEGVGMASGIDGSCEKSKCCSSSAALAGEVLKCRSISPLASRSTGAIMATEPASMRMLRASARRLNIVRGVLYISRIHSGRGLHRSECTNETYGQKHAAGRANTPSPKAIKAGRGPQTTSSTLFVALAACLQMEALPVNACSQASRDLTLQSRTVSEVLKDTSIPAARHVHHDAKSPPNTTIAAADSCSNVPF